MSSQSRPGEGKRVDLRKREERRCNTFVNRLDHDGINTERTVIAVSRKVRYWLSSGQSDQNGVYTENLSGFEPLDMRHFNEMQ